MVLNYHILIGPLDSLHFPRQARASWYSRAMPKIDGRTLDHKTLEHLRKLAVKRVIEDGEAPSEVMESLGLCRTTIYPWLRRYEDKGMEALVEKIAQGPEPTVTDKQRQQFRRWILGKGPRQYGFDFAIWIWRFV